VRDASEYFRCIQDVKITKAMLDLARHIVEQKSGHFQPDKFEDLLRVPPGRTAREEAEGVPIAAAKKVAPSNVVNLMDALRASLKSGEKTPAAARSDKTTAKKAPGSARQDAAPAHQGVR